jgi:hypothetical protein
MRSWPFFFFCFLCSCSSLAPFLEKAKKEIIEEAAEISLKEIIEASSSQETQD